MQKSAASGRVLYMEVAAAIEQSIMRGEWVPGQKLPPLADLAAHFEVSRTVVREACSVLVGSGLIELRHGDGTYVRSFSLEHFLRPLHAALLLGQADVRALLEIAVWLERGIAESAAERRSDGDCTSLGESLFAMECARGTIDEMVEAERGFHFALADAAHNEMASNLMRIVYQAIAGVLRLLLQEQGCEEQWLSVHTALYDSIVQMNADAAGRVISLYRNSQEEKVRKLRETPVN